MKNIFKVLLVLALSILLCVPAFASDGGVVPDPDDAKEQHGSYLDNKEEDNEADNAAQKTEQLRQTLVEYSNALNEALKEGDEEKIAQAEKDFERANEALREHLEQLQETETPTETQKVTSAGTVDVGMFIDTTSDMEDGDGLWYYHAADKRLTLNKTNICLTGENPGISIEPTEGSDKLYIKDLTIDSTGAKCACGKSCAFCCAHAVPLFLMVNVEGENSITVATGSVMYWVSDSLELYGNGRVTFIGNEFAFSDPGLTVRVSGADVTFTGETDFANIIIDGGSLTLPYSNQSALITNKSSDSRVYFDNDGKLTEVAYGTKTPSAGETWPDNAVNSKDDPMIISVNIIWVVLAPLILTFVTVGLLIALIYKRS